MGKETVWIRIANSGFCPRNRLLVFGLSDEGSDVDRTNPHSIFKSGAKIAPLVALRAGIDVRVVSSDQAGQYCLRYEARPSSIDEGFNQYVIVIHPKDGVETDVPMPFSVDTTYKNWSNAIGDDPLTEFPIWREYMNNARGNDPKGPEMTECEKLYWMPAGQHAVYIRKTADYEVLMRHPARYFKWLSGTPAVHRVVSGQQGIVMRVFPKSEEGATRLFAHGTLAYCSKDGADASHFDYSFDTEGLLTEERVFANMSEIYQWMGTMLSSKLDQGVLLPILGAIQDGKAPFEEHALSYALYLDEIIGEETWRAAWHAMYGAEAVMSNPGFGDEYVRSSLGKKPIIVTSPTLRSFLKRCGVAEANDFAPKMIEGTTFKVVELDEAEKARARLVFDAMRLEHPDVSLPIYPFESLVGELAMIEGFLLKTGDGTSLGIYIKKKMYRSTRWLMVVVNHEYRHARTNAADFSKPFEECADQDEGLLLLKKHGIQDDTPSDVDLALEELSIDVLTTP
ncbi:MAG: hypothetical protein WC866_03735 [Patescibacteria group bacterium]|jgi:hypothetical protein